MTTKAFDAKKWASSQTQRRGGRPCAICGNAEVARACDDAGEVWATERPDGLSYAAIMEMLEKQFGFTCASGTVRGHFAKHRQELFRRINGG